MIQKRNNIIAVLLHLTCVVVCVLASVETVEHSQTQINYNSDGAVLILSNDEQNECIRNNCAFGTYTTDSIMSKSVRNETKQIHFGVLLPSKSSISDRSSQILSTTLPVIELAIKYVHDKELLKGCELKVHYRDTQGSSIHGGLAAFDLYNRGEADVFLGPIHDYVLAPVARYSGMWKIPVITTGGLAAAFQFKANQFPTLTRMISYSELSASIKNILKHYNWNIIGVLYHNFLTADKGHSDCSLCIGPLKGMVNKTASENQQTFDENVTHVELRGKLEELKTVSRIVIMCANPKIIRSIMIAADELSMIDSGEYVFFNIELFGSLTKESTPWYDKNDTAIRNEQAKKAFQALLTITTKKPMNQAYDNFSNEVKELAKSKYNYTFDENEQISTFVTAFYDAVLLFAYSMNASIAEIGEDALIKPLNGTRLTELMWNSSFEGITGPVRIDANGDRLSDYSLLDMDPITNRFHIVANYFHATGFTFVQGKEIHWAGDRTEPPADRPECGFDNSLCPDDSSKMLGILSIVLGFVVVLMGIVSFVGYRHYKLEAEISSMTWKVNYLDVIPGINQMRGSLHSRTGSQLSVYSEEFMGEKQIYIPIGSYRGNTVAIKKISSPINLNRSLMLQLKMMKDIQHEHLVRFVGACIEGEVRCILTDYCSKGSLQDILENHEIKLDWMFKLSLMHDIVKGMHYLHTTPIHSHGQLKSSNCVVDSRFVLKITDFGMHELRKSSESFEDKESHEYWKKYLWTAPELLRLPFIPDEGSQKGDIYSFAIIVQEIVSRQGVFHLGNAVSEKTPREIIQLVCNNTTFPIQPFRPVIEDNKESCSDINSLMIKCWAEDPLDRPDFSSLKNSIRKINKENESGNLLDNLLKRMEHYATNLEDLVTERTKDYFEEKKKCEELLYQLLPVTIAVQLINGQSVMAETYENVTIYFSDIVGFTSISAESTPMQVVDLLNDLYTCFDKIVGYFDVYKVETIGDAYMVVSGLPVRNGDLHAREIARMALAFLEKVKNFQIRHRPEEKLKLRIGLHSGPCCAGVVGQKMPRYCLFGDTVNTASRMESNGEALKIHMSHTTKQILDRFGNFDVTLRGFVSMKGKGDMLTFWLNGEKPMAAVEPLPPFNPTKEEATLTELNDNIFEQNHSLPPRTDSVPTLTPSSKRSVLININHLNNNNNHSHSNNDISRILKQANGKKQSFFGKKKQVSLNAETIQPLLSTIK